jgi:hypothetical protein
MLPESLIIHAQYCTLIVRGQTAFSHTIKPVIAATYPFASTITAFEALQQQNSVGKIVINTEQARTVIYQLNRNKFF